MAWEGDSYQERFDALAAEGRDVHGEAASSASCHPSSVLDAGCGTGRVAIELARRGIEVVGVDAERVDAATAATGRRTSTWVESDVAALDLGRGFDVVVMAGNVPLFTPPGTQRPRSWPGSARHSCRAARWSPASSSAAATSWRTSTPTARPPDWCSDGRWATWARDPFPGDGSYAVSVHRRAGRAAGR